MSLRVRLASAADLPAVYALRHEVFVVGQDVPEELERDELDDGADHAVALLDAAVVGTGRLVDGRIDEQGRLEPASEGAVGTVGRMAVDVGVRGRGVGRALLDLLVARAAERGLPAVELHAQVHAQSFYEHAGFTAFGEVYLEAGIEHVGMRRELVPKDEGGSQDDVATPSRAAAASTAAAGAKATTSSPPAPLPRSRHP